MSSEKIEGTIRFEGMLQGRFPSVDDFPAKLREWVALMEGLGVSFHADISDDGFSLLPNESPASTQQLGDAPEQAVQQAIEQLLEQYPEHDPAQLSSTLRSREYRPKEEVQTMYMVAGRAVKAQSRTLEANTTPPPEPLSTKQKVQMGLYGLGMAVAFFGILMLFPGVRAMVSSVQETVRPIEPKEIKIETGPYAAYFTHTLDEKKSSWSTLHLEMKRTDKFPINDEKLKGADTEARENIRQRMALESLVRGHIRIEFYDSEEKLIGVSEFRPVKLYKNETDDLSIPFPTGVRITRILFVP